ncbi:hypothetical protein EUX98_g593 [Antrodiella citrinella]|uniref:Ricin B lectin domain-containing protein n=1 Tax=Antrodiella citrinella TaxID=2447956 RepID=A0A4S4N6P1_9APHY|nr:hypothetical protein EUX98_g593 [Antrodiella citrinella]
MPSLAEQDAELGEVVSNTADPGDASVFYLSQIAQILAASQSPSGTNFTSGQLIPLPEFQASAAVVRVNILWVLSLIVSLACALGATLIQTWSNRYTRLTTQFGNVSHRAQQREFYFEGIKHSRLVAVAEALPALLHLSLFLFLAGLVDFFFQVNVEVAYVTLGAVIVVSFMYLILTAMPLIFTSTPYQTPLSIRVPKSLHRVFHRAYQARFKGRPRGPSGDDFVLQQSRALQWLLDRMTGVYIFDKFVEGIEPFLGTTDQGTRIIFQLNVKPAADGRRCLSAHIGFRLHSCLEPSIDIHTRRSHVRAMTGALWSLLIRIQAGDMDDNIAPGGVGDSDAWYPVSQHLQQWLHPYTLRSLRRLRGNPDPLISTYAVCTCVVILERVLPVFCDSLKGRRTLVPASWDLMQILSACDSTELHPSVKTSYGFDVLVTCLLDPPDDELGRKSRAEANLDESEPWPQHDSSMDLRMVSSHDEDVDGLTELTEDVIRNSFHLAALNLLLEHLLTKTSNLQPTTALIDMIQSTIKLVVVNTSAQGTDEDLQRSFVVLLEKLFYSHQSSLLCGRAIFLMEDIRRLAVSLSKTLDHPIWAPKSAELLYGIRRPGGVENFVMSDAHSGRVGRVVFDAQVRPNANYFVCCEGRSNVLDLSGSDGRSVLVYAFHGGENQQWQLLKNGQSWTLRNVNVGTFLNVDNPAEEVNLYASTRATAWEVRPVESGSMKYYIYCAGTQLAIARGRSGVGVLSTKNALQWDFGRIGFAPKIKANVEYYFMHGEASTALDLSGEDYRTTLVFAFHGGDNQRWKLLQDEEYWLIQNRRTGAFLNINGPLAEHTKPVGSYEGRGRWDIRPDEGHSTYYNLFYAGSQYAVVQDDGDREPFLSQSEGTTRIHWKLVKCADIVIQPDIASPFAAERSLNVNTNLNLGLGNVTVKSGSKYLLYCHETNNVLDLHAGNETIVLIWGCHGGLNQKWLFNSEGDRWTIQNMNTNGYLGIDGAAVDGAAVIVTEEAAHWEIRPYKALLVRDTGGPVYNTVRTTFGPRYNIFYAGTQFSLAAGAHQRLEAGEAIILSGTIQ